jgi:hypothetical protein
MGVLVEIRTGHYRIEVTNFTLESAFSVYPYLHIIYIIQFYLN